MLVACWLHACCMFPGRMYLLLAHMYVKVFMLLLLHVYCMLAACLLHACCMFAACLMHVCCMLAACLPHACSMLAACLLQLLAACLLHACWMLTACLLNVYCNVLAACLMSVLKLCSAWNYYILSPNCYMHVKLTTPVLLVFTVLILATCNLLHMLLIKATCMQGYNTCCCLRAASMFATNWLLANCCMHTPLVLHTYIWNDFNVNKYITKNYFNLIRVSW